MKESTMSMLNGRHLFHVVPAPEEGTAPPAGSWWFGEKTRRVGGKREPATVVMVSCPECTKPFVVDVAPPPGPDGTRALITATFNGVSCPFGACQFKIRQIALVDSPAIETALAPSAPADPAPQEGPPGVVVPDKLWPAIMTEDALTPVVPVFDEETGEPVPTPLEVEEIAPLPAPLPDAPPADEPPPEPTPPPPTRRRRGH